MIFKSIFSFTVIYLVILKFKLRGFTVFLPHINVFYVQYEACFMCAGFYGLNFNQPLCSTCHMFLYPSNINWLEEAAYAEVRSFCICILLALCT